MTATPRKTSGKKTAGSKGPEKKGGAGSAPAASRAAKPKPKPPAKKLAAKAKSAIKAEPKGPPPREAKRPTAKKTLEPSVAKPRAVVKQVKLPKSLVDPEWLKAIREALVQQRQRLQSIVQATAAQMAERTGDLPDVSDRASEGYGDELAAGLMAVEAAQLDEIEYAIRRIDNGSYGICLDCRKAIPRKRLEILPFAHRCLSCKGAKERQAFSGYDEDEVEGKTDNESDADTESEDRD